MIRNIFLISLAIVSSFCLFTSCSDDDDNDKNGSAPVVRYVRVTDAASSDSIVTSAYLGATIAVIGDHLANVKEIWFNDQVAKLNPVYVTENAIVVNIPNNIPEEKTDKMRLITKNGIETIFDFAVDVPAPILNSLRCEYVADGEIAIINGDFFLEPKVFFDGNMPAEIKEFTKTQIQVVVPEGSKAGPITVQSLYGTTRSLFVFRDNNIQTPTTHVFLDFEETASWNTWSLSAFGSGGGPTGQFLIFEGATGSWAWPANPLQLYYNNPSRKPIASEGDIATMALRFEVNSEEWQDTPLLIWFSDQKDVHDVDKDAAQAHWRPYLTNGVKSNYVTNGWVTVTIPLSDFKYNKDESEQGRSITSLSQLVDLHAMFFGAADGESSLKVMIDNMRIVKYK